ncbi:MAG: Gfo/Idh/MocA family oxidoreductase [Verrucomicrobiota bacterium JB024]|nr:Gfo/Idh/MocA family oxidoreductase [Verrucomicrobiota bacterium JB024]
MKVCLIGCGAHSRWVHGPALKKYVREHPDTQLASCCDLRQDLAQAFARDFGFARHESDWQRMLDHEKPDAVSVVLPPKLIAQITPAILDRGIPVLVEKPPGLTLHELDILNEAAQRTGTPHLVAFNRRFTPLVAEVQRLLKKDFPPVDVMQINYDMIRNQRGEEDFSITAVHSLDTVGFLARSPFVQATFDHRISDKTGAVEASFMRAKCECGTSVHCHFLPATGVLLERFAIYGKDRTLTVELPMWGGYDTPGCLHYWVNGELALRLSGDDLPDGAELFEQSGFYQENACFLDALRSGSALSPGFEEVRPAVYLMEQYRLAKAGPVPLAGITVSLSLP